MDTGGFASVPSLFNYDNTLCRGGCIYQRARRLCLPEGYAKIVPGIANDTWQDDARHCVPSLRVRAIDIRPDRRGSNGRSNICGEYFSAATLAFLKIDDLG